MKEYFAEVHSGLRWSKRDDLEYLPACDGAANNPILACFLPNLFEEMRDFRVGRSRAARSAPSLGQRPSHPGACP
jgi:hypothetical protein